jgi:hypothetical protein
VIFFLFCYVELIVNICAGVQGQHRSKLLGSGEHKIAIAFFKVISHHSYGGTKDCENPVRTVGVSVEIRKTQVGDNNSDYLLLHPKSLLISIIYVHKTGYDL